MSTVDKGKGRATGALAMPASFLSSSTSAAPSSPVSDKEEALLEYTKRMQIIMTCDFSDTDL
jgi:hypothetical protein